jgi:hypothetical protein
LRPLKTQASLSKALDNFCQNLPAKWNPMKNLIKFRILANGRFSLCRLARGFAARFQALPHA